MWGTVQPKTRGERHGIPSLLSQKGHPGCDLTKILGKLYSYPIGSMYGIFTYIWLKFIVNVGEYSIHGAYGHPSCFFSHK